jgi:hypothetical protein
MSIVGNLGIVSGQNGKRFASGTLTPASPDVQVTTGLKLVDHCGVTLVGVPAASHNQSIAEPGTVDGDIRIQSYEPDHTDSTTEVAVTWWAMGD